MRMRPAIGALLGALVVSVPGWATVAISSPFAVDELNGNAEIEWRDDRGMATGYSARIETRIRVQSGNPITEITHAILRTPTGMEPLSTPSSQEAQEVITKLASQIMAPLDTASLTKRSFVLTMPGGERVTYFAEAKRREALTLVGKIVMPIDVQSSADLSGAAVSARLAGTIFMTTDGRLLASSFVAKVRLFTEEGRPLFQTIRSTISPRGISPYDIDRRSIRTLPQLSAELPTKKPENHNRLWAVAPGLLMIISRGLKKRPGRSAALLMYLAVTPMLVWAGDTAYLVITSITAVAIATGLILFGTIPASVTVVGLISANLMGITLIGGQSVTQHVLDEMKSQTATSMTNPKESAMAQSSVNAPHPKSINSSATPSNSSSTGTSGSSSTITDPGTSSGGWTAPGGAEGTSGSGTTGNLEDYSLPPPSASLSVDGKKVIRSAVSPYYGRTPTWFVTDIATNERRLVHNARSELLLEQERLVTRKSGKYSVSLGIQVGAPALGEYQVISNTVEVDLGGGGGEEEEISMEIVDFALVSNFDFKHSGTWTATVIVDNPTSNPVRLRTAYYGYVSSLDASFASYTSSEEEVLAGHGEIKSGEKKSVKLNGPLGGGSGPLAIELTITAQVRSIPEGKMLASTTQSQRIELVGQVQHVQKLSEISYSDYQIEPDRIPEGGSPEYFSFNLANNTDAPVTGERFSTRCTPPGTTSTMGSTAGAEGSVAPGETRRLRLRIPGFGPSPFKSLTAGEYDVSFVVVDRNTTPWTEHSATAHLSVIRQDGPVRISSASVNPMEYDFRGGLRASFPGTTLTISGDGFAAGQRIQIVEQGGNDPMEMVIGEAFSDVTAEVSNELPFGYQTSGSVTLVSPQEIRIEYRTFDLVWNDPIFSVPLEMSCTVSVFTSTGNAGPASYRIRLLPDGADDGGGWEGD